MELIDQNTKKIMEACKERAKSAGLSFDKETMEYIVTNADMIMLSPKVMIPTLYDYWVHDVEVIKGKGVYDVYPHNAYETVINTRPGISFYNDNNPDWLNVMIFYHVLGHIDFFQNNLFYRNTWSDDFRGQALSDSRLINRMRERMGEKKRWVDYVIEFSRGIDNIVGYYDELNDMDRDGFKQIPKKADFYFGGFFKKLYDKKETTTKEYGDELERYNNLIEKYGEKRGDEIFFEETKKIHPEFESQFKRHKKKQNTKTKDVMQYVMENSDFLKKRKNMWMKEVMQVVRNTSLFFQPQIRTKIINEGWASLWHQKLFLTDERMSGHEVVYSVINAGVMAMPRVGLNPYALGCALLGYIRDMAERGKLSHQFQKIRNAEERKNYGKDSIDKKRGKDFLFEMRRTFNDSMLVNFLTDDDFQDFVDKNKLFVVGQKLDLAKRVVRYFIQSRKGVDYRKMVNNSLYHPPHVFINEEKVKNGELYLDHVFEERTLITKFIPAVMRGLEYFWRGPENAYGGVIKLETTEFEVKPVDFMTMWAKPDKKPEFKKVRVVYTLDKGKLERNVNK